MTEDEKWHAVINNDTRADGLFYYAVKSTGIYCRPSCKSKEPIRENVVFFDSGDEAVAAGYRPCKRCRPELAVYQPIADIAQQAKIVIEKYYSDKQRMTDELQKLGVSKRRIDQIFKQHCGVSLNEYANSLKLQAAKEELQRSNTPVIDIAYALGFESLSAFFAFFRKNTGITPRKYRNQRGDTMVLANTYYSVYETAFGQFTIVSNDSSIVAVKFGRHILPGNIEQRTELTDETAKQLEEYFAGKRRQFDIPFAPQGTEFQKKVWNALCQVPYGETRTYKEIAVMVGNPNASRAVGLANNRNPIPVFIPCHRIIGTNGSLVGYAGGLDMKEKLLQIEQNGRIAGE